MQENNIVITTDSKNEVIIDNDKKSYSYFLYQERIKLNLKRRKFAKHLKIRPLRYSFIERGYFKPKKKEIKKISNYLGIDYSIYMEGLSSYPTELPEKQKTKLIRLIYKMLSKTSFKIVNCILILLAIASIALCFSFQSYFSKNSRDCLTEEYLEVFDLIAQKGTISISVTTDSVTRPEIYKLENNKYVSIVSSYTHTDVLNIKYTYSKKQDDYKIAITSNMKDSLSNKFTIKVIYTDLNDYTSYTTSYYLDLEKNNFVKSKGYYDLEQKIEDRINLMISEFSTEMEKLVEEKLDLKISFYEDLVHDVMNSKSIILKRIIFLFSGGLASVCILIALIYLLIYSFLYGNNEYNIQILRNSTTYSELTINRLGYKEKVKKDIRIFPIIPESILKLIGILLTCTGSIRILLIFLKFLGFFPDSPLLKSLGTDLDIWFNIGLFLIFFINFDIFKDDRRSIRNVFLYFLVFIGLYVIELIIIFTVKKFAVGKLFLENTNSTLPNYFGTICCYFLIMLFLFNNPKWANTTKRLITFRLLSLIPVTLIIITTILNYVSKMNNWNIPLWFAYLINTGRPQISILCILYLFGLYILRVAFKLRYGTDTCKKYFNGNRYMIYKNILMFTLILLISIMELIFSNNTLAHKFDLGLYPHIILLAPLMLLYHPHIGGRNKRSDYVIMGLYIFFFGFGYFIIGSIVFLLFL